MTGDGAPQPRVGFVTCVELGLSCMREIYEIGGRLDCAISLHDNLSRHKSGRVFLDDFCGERGLSLYKVRNINDEDSVSYLRSRCLDWLFIIGWSQIAKSDILEVARHGALGMHPTLLPEGRGRASVPWAILKRLPRTGVTLFKLDQGVDTGPILEQVQIPLAPDETSTALYAKVAQAHQVLIRRAWPAITSGQVALRSQDHALATNWPGRTPEDGRIVTTMCLDEVETLVRASTRPYPGAFLDLPDGRLRIWSGAPASALTQAAAAARHRITLSDGEYIALEFEFEPVNRPGISGDAGS